MKKPQGLIDPKWIIGARKDLLHFLKMTGFPVPSRNGTRGPEFEYPEWLIMFIAVLSVKAKVKSYVGIHALATRYWKYISADKRMKMISESTLRDRLKKICHSPGRPAVFIFQIFPEQMLQSKAESGER